MRKARLRFVLGARPALLSADESIHAFLGLKPADQVTNHPTILDALIAQTHPFDLGTLHALFAPERQDETKSANLRLLEQNGKVLCLTAEWRRKHLDEHAALVLDLLLQDARTIVRKPDETHQGLQFNAIMENSDALISFKDHHHIFTHANPALQEFVKGLASTPDPVGLTDYDIFPRDLADQLYAMEQQILAGAPVAQDELRHTLADGTHRWVDERKYPTRNERGEIVGVLNITRSITTKRALEVALNDTETRYEIFAAATSEGILVSSGNTIIDFNTQFSAMLGYTREELLRTNRNRLILEEERTRLHEAAVSDKETVLEHYLVRKDGSTILVQSHGKNYSLNGVTTRLNTIRDITADRAAEQKIRDSESNFRRMFEKHAAIMILLSPETGEIRNANDAAAHFYGYTVEQLKHMKVSDINAHSAEEIRAEMAQAVAHKRNFFEFRHRIANGNIRNVEVRSSPIELDGQTALFSVISDITERKQAERALRSSEMRFRHLFDDVDALAIQGYREDRSVAYWNKASERLYGYSEDEALSSNLLSLIIPPAMHELVTQATDEMFRTRIHIPSGRMVLRNKNGRDVPVYSSHTLVEVEDQPPLMFCMDVDLRELEQAESEVRKLSEAIAQNPSSILILEANGRIEYANAAFTKNTGYTFEEAKDRLIDFLCRQQTRPEEFSELKEAIEAGTHWSGEIVNTRKDGGQQIVILNVAPIRGGNNEIERFVIIQEDVTENREIAAQLDRYRHHLEEMLAERSSELLSANSALEIARDAAEAAARAKSAFLANMSHELRTPINAIIGFAELLRRSEASAQNQEWIGKIHESVNHLLHIVNDVLDLTRIEAGKLPLHPAQFNVREVLTQLLTYLRQTSKARNLDISLDIDPTLPTSLHGDAVRLLQALRHYGFNAVKFTHNGFVRITAQVVETTSSGLMVRFSVRDSGIGIPDSIGNQLFHRFDRADAKVMYEYGGLGVGLSLTRQIARMLGGDVGFESQEGKGSTFWLTAQFGYGEDALAGTPQPHTGNSNSLAPLATPPSGNSSFLANVSLGSESELRQVLDQLSLLLENDDLQAINYLKSVMPVLSSADKQDISLLAICIKAFDYQAAMEIVVRLRAGLSPTDQ